MSYSHKRSSHGSGSRSGSSPIIKDILRGAFDAFTESSSASHSRSSSSSRRDRDYDRDYHREAPRRTYTQPEPRRHRDADEYTGIPSHSSKPSSNSDELKEMLGKAAIELSRLVGSFEQKLRSRDRVDARPGQFRSDEERFEVLSDSDPETPYQSTSRGGNMNQQYQQYQQQPTPRGHADEYYFPEYLPGNTHTTPVYPDGQNNIHNAPQMSYQHPQSVDPTYPDYHNPADVPRPKPKRSSTSASQTMRKVGTEMLQNLPQLLERAGWLLKVLDAQQQRSGGKRSITGYSGLLMALNLVMELYRQFGGEKRVREEGNRRY